MDFLGSLTRSFDETLFAKSDTERKVIRAHYVLFLSVDTNQVLEAVSAQNWGASTSLMSEIAEETKDL